MEGADGLQQSQYMRPNSAFHATYVALDAGDEELVGIRLGVLHEVRRGLLGRDSDERHALVGRLEPDDLGALDGAAGLVALVALALAALGLLLLLGCRRGRAEEAQGAGEELAGHALDNSHNVARELGLDLIGDPAKGLAYDQPAK